MKPDDKMNVVPPKMEDWKTKGFDANLQRQFQNTANPGFIAGVNFDALLDEMLFNRMLRLKNLPVSPQGNEPAKIYWDSVNKKYKIWVDATGKWADVVYTTTSTSTTSSSSSSTSTT